jgi:MFS family permease
VLGTSFVYFIGFGITMPALPLYVVEELDRGEVAVGLVFGAYAVTATLLRPLVGRVGVQRGRGALLVAGGAISMVGLLLHPVVPTVAGLVAARLIVGVGHAAVMVGATTLALDLAPPGRRGESSSYVMVAIQVGMGTGPVAGEALARSVSFTAAWLAAAGCSLAVALLALRVPRPEHVTRGRPRSRLHPSGLRVGSLMGLPLIGFAGFLAFVPLYGPTIDVPRVGLLFVLASGSVAVTRLVGARVPDRFGGRRTARASLALVTLAFALMAVWAEPIGLYVATVLMAVGIGMVVPALIVTAIERVPDDEHAEVMAALTIFVDVAAALGPTLLGALAAGPGYGAAFGATSAIALVALLTMDRWLGPDTMRPAGTLPG